MTKTYNASPDGSSFTSWWCKECGEDLPDNRNGGISGFCDAKCRTEYTEAMAEERREKAKQEYRARRKSRLARIVGGAS